MAQSCNPFHVGQRVYYEYTGAGDQVKKVYGQIVDVWGRYVDVLFGNQHTSWPIRAELVHPDDGQEIKREARHVLC
jgi:hypothetical protein